LLAAEVNMGRILARTIGAAGAVAFVGLASQGCADNETMLFARAVLAIAPPDCLAEPDPNSAFRSAGTLDIAFGTSYIAPILVGNQLVRRGSKNQLRTESNRVTLKGAEVEVLDDQDNSLAEFTVPGSGFVDPGVGEEAGYGVLFAQLVPPGLTLSAGARIVVEVRVFGDTLGGEEIESSTLRYPIYVCDGCLISFPADADDPVQPGYQCVGTKPPSSEAPCFFGQDDPVDCRHCLSLGRCQTPS
jgi:hypothetical protein